MKTTWNRAFLWKKPARAKALWQESPWPIPGAEQRLWQLPWA